MVDYLPKATAPVAFNAIDAILSAIHNDPVWGWLEGYAHLYPNQYVDTATFCSQGPRDAPAIGLGDLLNLAPLGTPEYFESQQKIARKIEGILHDRLFGAMCELPNVPTAGWCPPFQQTITGMSGGVGGEITVPVPSSATQVRISLRSRTVVGGAWGVLVYKRPAGGGAASVIQGYDLSTSAPSGQSISTFAAGGQLECNQSGNNGNVSVFEFEFNDGCAGTPFVPTPQPAPTGFLPRVVPPTAAVADLAPILFAIELKLEELLRVERQVAIDQLPNQSGVDDAVTAEPDVEIDATNWLGAVITVSGVPSSVDVGFGTPQEYTGLGRVNIGTPIGWYPAIPITASPMVIRPMPPETTRVTVSIKPPATATVAPILPTNT